MNPQDPLAQLKDIHLPEPVGWWPLAWGWWLLMALILVVLAVVLWRGHLRRRRQRYRRDALTLLERALLDFQREEPGPEARRHYLQQVSQLLRRTALSALPTSHQSALASLNGEQWLRFLDLSAKVSPGFTDGAGRALAQGPYQPDPEVEVEALHRLAQQWIRHHRLSSARRLQELLEEVRHA